MRAGMRGMINALIADATRRSEHLALFEIRLTLASLDGGPLGAATHELLIGRVRPALGDDICCIGRLDGQRDIAVVLGLDCDAAAALAAGRLIDRLAGRFRLGTRAVQVGVQVGIARLGRDGENLDPILNHAGKALNVARSCGADRYAFAGQPPLTALLAPSQSWKETGEGSATGMGDVLDAQFRSLQRRAGAILSTLHQSGVDLDDYQGVRAALDELIEALGSHFQAEEQSLQGQSHVQALAHHQAHQQFLRELRYLGHGAAGQEVGLIVAHIQGWLNTRKAAQVGSKAN
jgi:hemerythrin